MMKDKKFYKVFIFIFLCCILCVEPILATTLNPGEVSFGKTAEWVDKENGIAKVTLSVEAEPMIRPADVVLLVDRSASMTFSRNSWDLSGQDGVYSKCMNAAHWKDGKHYYDTSDIGILEMQDRYDKDNGCTDRFDITIDAVSKFLDTFYEYSEENRVAVVTFCGQSSANYNLDFTTDRTQILNDEGTGIIQQAQKNIGSGTSYSAGFSAVQKFIEDRNLRETGDKNKNSRPTYVIFLTDGKPTDGNQGITIANTLKEKGMIVYAIGIDQVSDTYLKQIATSSYTQEYYRAVTSASELTGFYDKIASRVNNAGTNARITDVIGNDFEYYEDETHQPTATPVLLPKDSSDGKTIQWEQKELLDGIKQYEFYIRLKTGEAYDNGTWNTNQKAELTYTDVYGENQTVEKESPTLSRHKYQVEHYKQNEDGTYPNLPTEVETFWADEGDVVCATPKNYEFFTFNSKVEGSKVEGVIEAQGKLVLKLYYERQTSEIVVKYVDVHGNEIAPSDTFTGILGTNYQVERKDIVGYKAYGENPSNMTGVYTQEKQEIVFVYEQTNGIVRIVYMDDQGNKICEDDVLIGIVGKEYETQRKEIEGYSAYGENPKNQKGIYTEEETLVTYLYQKNKVIEIVDTSDIQIGLLLSVVILSLGGISFVVYRKLKQEKN